MNRLITWLSGYRIINYLVILLYFAAVVLPHKRFGTFINNVLFKDIPRDDSNLYVIVGALTVLAFYGLIFTINVRQEEDRKKLWSYMVINVLLAALIINTLFVNNVEVVHFPQYAIFAMLIFPILGNYSSTLIWTTLIGVVDEAYQYFYLAPMDTSYFDFNDVITDLVGAVFGLLLLRSLHVIEWTKFRLSQSSIWYGIGLLLLVTAIVHMTGILSIYPNEERAYHILRTWPPGFWSKVHPNVTFHVVRPLEGILITVILWIFYSKLKPSQP